MSILRFDLERPWAPLARMHAHPTLFPMVLESVARGQAPARHDLLFASNGEYLLLDARGCCHDQNGPLPGTDFLAELRRRWQATGTESIHADAPFQGGYALFLSYEFARVLEPTLLLPESLDQLPVALALRCPAVVQYDYARSKQTLICESAHRELAERILGLPPDAPIPAQDPYWEVQEEPEQQFLDGVHRVKEYLAAGDIFQANLSRLWQARTTVPIDPIALYQRLRQANPAPFAGLLRFADWHLLSSSPERLVRVHGRDVEARPIAGTRARNADDHEWLQLPRDPKERAEHVMLIDLVRNDLGRVCLSGSVHVDQLLQVESYAHVHHIVSNVTGQLRSDCDALHALAAMFPGGTITGCPKLRSMAIIAELEGVGRGPYTGSLGYLSRDGRMDMNILIRSVWGKGNELRLRAGAGIVADSVPTRELAETRAKAIGMLRALQ